MLSYFHCIWCLSIQLGILLYKVLLFCHTYMKLHSLRCIFPDSCNHTDHQDRLLKENKWTGKQDTIIGLAHKFQTTNIFFTLKILMLMLSKYHNVAGKWRSHYSVILLYCYILNILHIWIGYPKNQWLKNANEKYWLIRCSIEIHVKGIKCNFSISDSEVLKFLWMWLNLHVRNYKTSLYTL